MFNILYRCEAVLGFAPHYMFSSEGLGCGVSWLCLNESAT